jgi:HSP20 family protein
MAMNTLVPWVRRTENLFEDFRQEMNDVARRFFPGPASEGNGGMIATWQPRCDIEENDKEILVKVDLPGVDPKEIDISISDDMLVVRGEKKEEKEEKKKNYHRVERFVGQFYRTIDLPAGTDAEKIAAASANGTVTITIPKKPGTQPKKIAVKPEK